MNRPGLGVSLALLLGLALGVSRLGLGAPGAGLRVCELYQNADQNEIATRIKAGIPFELMGALFEDGTLVSKKVVQISFNLWDEVVTVKAGEQRLGKFAFKDGASELCKFLDNPDSALKPGRKYVFRLLLNPMWGERMARLQLSESHDQGGPVHGLIGIDWRKLAADMPSDKVLLEKEIDP